MREIYEVLTSLEGTAAELVVRRGITAGELAKLKAAVHAMDAALDADNLQAWAEADELFHTLLAGCSGNGRLARTIGQFQSQAHRARLLTLRLRPKPVTSNRDHEALVRAIEKGDSKEARRIHSEHRERAGQLLVTLLEKLPQIQV
jgi:DNA-binding GntR family transcriptional regulator